LGVGFEFQPLASPGDVATSKMSVKYGIYPADNVRCVAVLTGTGDPTVSQVVVVVVVTPLTPFTHVIAPVCMCVCYIR